MPRGAPKSAVLPAAGSARALQPLSREDARDIWGYYQVFTVPDSACCIARHQTVMQGFPNKLRRNLYNILHRHVVGICHIFVLFCSFFVLFLVSFYFFPLGSTLVPMATMMLWVWTELGDVHELGMGRIYVTPAELRSGSDASVRLHAGQERSRAGDSAVVSQAQTKARRMERAH